MCGNSYNLMLKKISYHKISEQKSTPIPVAHPYSDTYRMLPSPPPPPRPFPQTNTRLHLKSFVIVTPRYLTRSTFSRSVPSKVYEAWIFLIRFLVSCIMLHLKGLLAIPLEKRHLFSLLMAKLSTLFYPCLYYSLICSKTRMGGCQVCNCF